MKMIASTLIKSEPGLADGVFITQVPLMLNGCFSNYIYPFPCGSCKEAKALPQHQVPNTRRLPDLGLRQEANCAADGISGR